MDKKTVLVRRPSGELVCEIVTSHDRAHRAFGIRLDWYDRFDGKNLVCKSRDLSREEILRIEKNPAGGTDFVLRLES